MRLGCRGAPGLGKLASLDLLELLHAALVAAGPRARLEPDLHDLVGEPCADDAGTHREHVGVVVKRARSGLCRGRCTARRARRAPCWPRAARPGPSRRSRFRARRSRATTSRATAEQIGGRSRRAAVEWCRGRSSRAVGLGQQDLDVLLALETRHVVGADRDPHRGRDDIRCEQPLDRGAGSATSRRTRPSAAVVERRRGRSTVDGPARSARRRRSRDRPRRRSTHPPRRTPRAPPPRFGWRSSGRSGAAPPSGPSMRRSPSRSGSLRQASG